MNKRQMAVLWIGGILLIAAFILSTYQISYRHGGPSILDELGRGWRVQAQHDPFLILSQLIRYVPAVLILTGLLLLSFKDKKVNPEVMPRRDGILETIQGRENKGNSKLSMLLIIVGSLWLFVGASTANKSALYAGWFILWGVLGYEARKSQKLGGPKAWLIIELPSVLIVTLSFLMGIINGFWYEYPLPFLIIPIVFSILYIHLWIKRVKTMPRAEKTN